MTSKERVAFVGGHSNCKMVQRMVCTSKLERGDVGLALFWKLGLKKEGRYVRKQHEKV